MKLGASPGAGYTKVEYHFVLAVEQRERSQQDRVLFLATYFRRFDGRADHRVVSTVNLVLLEGKDPMGSIPSIRPSDHVRFSG
jgi:hypothetical protein